ncbi:hypothetical protein GRF29_185g623412 [Pseudopithomyces chartarum]|uniref:Phosphoribulokinase/uridine kinase domain-containing protein n=1 Tax=Pseudopithomyces chartarum TaxID=1892770 RepID=A0AAN6LSA2_9PLEO|nr:hypothetical protein GRF29_185g623412 [Pseudopithomyces chartarum]
MAKDNIAETLTTTILNLAKRIEALLARQQSSDSPARLLIALAGVPGSGKSTVSQALLLELAAKGIEDVVVVPMDGFHYTKKILRTFKDSENAFKRRGAPFTFDADAFLSLVREMKAMPLTESAETEQVLYAPSFDHAIQDPITKGIPVPSRSRIVIIEGNYTLLDQDPWREVAALCEEKWFVDTPRDVALERLVQRHIAAGIETDIEKSVERVKANDLVNGDLIRSLLIEPDVIVEN